MTNEKNKALIILLLLLTTFLITQLAVGKEYNITELPFQDTTTKTIENITNKTNYTVDLRCIQLGGNQTLHINDDKCSFTSANQTTFNFSENQTKHNVTFNSSIEGPEEHGLYQEVFKFSRNNSIISNKSINFTYNISGSNASIEGVNPENGSFLGQNDEIPSRILINLSNSTNISKSKFPIKYNNQNISWYSVNKYNNTVVIQLEKVPDGRYSGNWTLFSKNITKKYYYELNIQTNPPPLPEKIKPTGQFIYQEANLRVKMPDNGNYSVYYITNDGFPSMDANWRKLSYDEGLYQRKIDFGSQGIGQIYLRITDSFGNYRIAPTRIVSGPGFKLNVEELSKTAEPGDRIKYDVTLSIKPGSGNQLSCLLTDFQTSYQEGGSNWNTRGRAFLQKSNFNGNPEQRMKLSSEFEETLQVTPSTTEELELVVNLPFEIESGIDYSSDLKCIVS